VQKYGWRIYIIAILACQGAFMFGYNLGVIGGIVGKLMIGEELLMRERLYYAPKLP
jgi:hypothetical protein